MGIEVTRIELRRRLRPAGQVAEADDAQLRLGRDRLEFVVGGDPPGKVGRQVDVGLDQAAQAAGAEMPPAQPQLERPEPAGALHRALVEVERLARAKAITGVMGIRLGLAAAVVLRAAMERLEQVGASADHEGTNVVRLEEPLVGVDRDRIGALQVRHPGRVAGRQADRAAVGGVDVEPQAVVLGKVGQVCCPVHRPGVRRAGHGADRERPQATGPIRLDRRGDRRAAQAERIVGGHDLQGVDRESELIEGPADREVGLIGGVHPGALELPAAGRMVQPQDLGQVQVAGHGQGHEVGHHSARGEHGKARRAVADKVAQPASDLLLDERARRPGMPDVDALVDELGQDLADDRHEQRRRGEVAQRARVVGVQAVGGEARSELGQQVG